MRVRRTPLPAHRKLRGLYSLYLHHNNKQMCKPLSGCNIIASTRLQSPRREKAPSDNYTLIPTFFWLSFTAHGNAVNTLVFLNCRPHKMVRWIGTKTPLAAERPHAAGGSTRTEELQLRPSSSGRSSFCSVLQTDQIDAL